MNRKQILTRICLPLFCLVLLFSSIFIYYNGCRVVFAIDPPYNNNIFHAEVWQFSGGYSLKANFTVTGGSVRVVDNQVIKIVIGLKANKTLFSSEAEAISYTRVYLNITDGGYSLLNQELSNNASRNFSDATFYYLREYFVWNVTGKPQAGITYTCSAKYQAYY